MLKDLVTLRLSPEEEMIHLPGSDAVSRSCVQLVVGSEMCDNPMLMQAFTWNGFEDGTTWMGGLWAGLNTQQGDFATITYRAQLYGFNAIRIPFRCGLILTPYVTHPVAFLSLVCSWDW